MLIASGCGNSLFRYFTVDRDGSIRANQCTNGATRASILIDLSRVKTFWSEPFHIQLQDILGAGTDTEFTSLAVQITDFDPSYCRHEYYLLLGDVG
jgi:hypothetical protein